MSPQRPRRIHLRRYDEHHDILFNGTQPMTRIDLHATLEPLLRAWIRPACTWKVHASGDYRFVVFFIDVTPDVQVSVRLWSEPLEPVVWDVSSDGRNMAANEWLAGEHADRLAPLGFTIGGAGSYRRIVDVRSRADISAIAAQMVRLFYETLNYRGIEPIRVRLVYDSRCEVMRTYGAFTLEQVSQLFARLGYEGDDPLADNEMEGSTSIEFRKDGLSTIVYFWDAIEGQNLYQRVRFDADIEVPDSAEQRLLNEAGDSFTTLSVEHAFGGGVTMDWLVARIGEWDSMVRQEQWRAENRRSSRPVVTGPTETVH